jgi:hypothetical protein
VPFLSDTYEGSCHDKPIADQTPYPLPKGSELLQDLGFVGFTLDDVEIDYHVTNPQTAGGQTELLLVAAAVALAALVPLWSIYAASFLGGATPLPYTLSRRFPAAQEVIRSPGATRSGFN